jgi:c-di-GMP-binding flagellar brake protein YcgR
MMFDPTIDILIRFSIAMTHSEENENPEFAIHNHKEIAAILGGLMKSRAVINLDTQGGVSLVTSVLEVSNEDNYVYLDISPDNSINDQIIHSKHVTFSTQTGIKVRWHSTHLHRVILPDGDALSMVLPAVIERIQRREYFRLNTPQGKEAIVCKIPVDEDIFEATVFDMSVGGVGVSIKGVLPDNFSQAGQFAGCSIEFPEIGIVLVGLRICRVWETSKIKSGELSTRFGMEFVNLSRGASNVIQRHMNQLQAESVATLEVP